MLIPNLCPFSSHMKVVEMKEAHQNMKVCSAKLQTVPSVGSGQQTAKVSKDRFNTDNPSQKL